MVQVFLRFSSLLSSSYSKGQKVKYLNQLLINQPNLSESSYGIHLQVL